MIASISIRGWLASLLQFTALNDPESGQFILNPLPLGSAGQGSGYSTGAQNDQM